MRWSEIYSTDTEKLADIAESLKVNPLAIEDCLHRDQRPKLDDYETHQLLVWFMFIHGHVYEIQFLIFPDHLILIPHEPPPEKSTWSEFLHVPYHMPNVDRDVWHMLYHALDRMTDITWQQIREVFTRIDAFEQSMFDRECNPRDLLILKSQLNQVDFSVGHLPSIAKQLQNLCPSQGDLAWKLRDLYDHCERTYRTIGLYRGQITSAIELYWGLEANRTNKQIKKLSLLASIAVPVTFWASFWGMNFEFIPYSRPELFFAAVFIMILSVAISFWVLVRKGYWSD